MTGHPDIVRARKHLKTVLAQAKDEFTGDPAAPDHVQWYGAGIVSGLAVAARILTGDSAEQAAEALEQALYAAVGQALLEGKITAPSGGTEEEGERHGHDTESA